MCPVASWPPKLHVACTEIFLWLENFLPKVQNLNFEHPYSALSENCSVLPSPNFKTGRCFMCHLNVGHVDIRGAPIMLWLIIGAK